MPKFRKKPVVVEAFQITRETRWDNRDWPSWLNMTWQKDCEVRALFPDQEAAPDGELFIYTLEGVHIASLGDWIIQGVNGEIYPCKPDIFQKSYEAAE